MRAYILMRKQVGHKDLSEPVDMSHQHTASNVQRKDVESDIIDLYAVQNKSDGAHKNKTKPFIHKVKLHRQKGEVVRMWGLFDN